MVNTAMGKDNNYLSSELLSLKIEITFESLNDNNKFNVLFLNKKLELF